MKRLDLPVAGKEVDMTSTDDNSEGTPKCTGEGWRSRAFWARGFGFLMAVVVLAGISVSGCNSVREDARIIIPDAMSPRVTRILQDMQSYLSQAYSAKDKKFLRKLSGLSNAIMECCKELQGENGDRAPSAEEWGGVSDEQYEQILKILSALERHAMWCRDYAKDMRYSQLEGAWKAFLGQYGVFRRVVEGMGP